MNNKINKILYRDCGIIAAILAVLWCILSFVMVQVSAMISNQAMRIGILTAGIFAGAFSTAAAAAVFMHLKKNREAIYTIEICAKNQAHDKNQEVCYEKTKNNF
ncbi:hypothetical protein FRZ06_00260 [Anoxybacterium hadale]|uniref:Uncharacterized protein n=1 Tax=Anoxybacterium hadale TaxID=3408580 RepID=A0ACD1A688_9FIRM|nr:hypothetical protein FRZ06_00260 [Clostridiales bacterium]